MWGRWSLYWAAAVSGLGATCRYEKAEGDGAAIRRAPGTLG